MALDQGGDSFLNIAIRLGRFLDASKITVDEYATNLVELSSLYDWDDATVESVAASVPKLARNRIADELSTVLTPDYRHPELHYGGPGPTREEREGIRLHNEKRIQAFAAALRIAMRRES